MISTAAQRHEGVDVGSVRIRSGRSCDSCRPRTARRTIVLPLDPLGKSQHVWHWSHLVTSGHCTGSDQSSESSQDPPAELNHPQRHTESDTESDANHSEMMRDDFGLRMIVLCRSAMRMSTMEHVTRFRSGAINGFEGLVQRHCPNQT